MVADLEDIDRSDQATRDECGLDRRLGVTGQQCREAAHLEQQHDRSVVDVALGKRRVDVGLCRIEDGGGGARSEIEALARACQDGRDGGSGRIGHQAVVGRVLERDPGVQHGADAVAIQHVDEPGDVVLVRMADHEHVDPSGEERQVRPDPSQRQLGVRPAVDERRRAVGRLDQDGVPLPDVEHREMQQPVRTRRRS